MNEAKNYKISIFGSQYSLKSDESEQHVMKVASLVDSYMNEISQKTGLTDSAKVAVLAGIQLANKLLSLENQLEEHTTKYKQFIEYIDDEINSCSGSL